ncbi:site-specific integrase [Haliea sp.]|uniref:tyrosine-type recombinase/integrase n=1 Tax=Haliea sp. TaxID=1932666 RepID=UPI000C6BAF1D|nr:site-specific integrase [Haliea sp.]MAY92565.1 integrase [Haliea sp.]
MPAIRPFQTQPVPLEGLGALPDALDGSWGSNRQTQDLCQFTAFNDLQAIRVWLDEFADSPQTYRNYRKEAERLLLWAVTQRQKPLSGLMREDFQAYQAFLADPQPAMYWCGPRAPRYSEQWRPFQGPLSASSQRQALIVVNALLSYLVDGGDLKANPLSLVRRRNRTLRPDVAEAFSQERYLDQATWGYLKAYIADLPQVTPREIQRFERTRFLFHFLYLLAPRVSEVASHPMNSIRESRGRWWWFALGKGSKLAKVPVSDEMLDALMRYRAFLGLTGIPDPDDLSPMLRSLKGTAGISANMVYRIVKETVTAAADVIEETAPVSAAKLRKASTHWLRHTAVTHADDAGVNLKYLQASARHEKVETTAIYQHAEDHRWHEAWKKLSYE